MTQEQANQVDLEAQANEADQEEAAARAALAEARGAEPPTPLTDQPSTAEQQQAQDESGHQDEGQQGENPQGDTPHADAKPKEEEPVFAGLTAKQIMEGLAKAGEVDGLKAQLRTVQGRYGELNARLQEMQKAQQTGEVSPEEASKVEELVQKYHEAVLDGNMEEARKLYMQTMRMPRPIDSGSAPQATGITEDVLQGALDQQANQFNRLIVRMRHPDFKEIVQSREYATWLYSLPEAELQEVRSSKDPFYAADKLDEFKKWRSGLNASQQQNQQRQQRLEAAVTPTGSAKADQPVISEEEAARIAIRERMNAGRVAAY